MPAPMTSVRLQHLCKRFGAATVVDDVDADIAPGELFFLLGPSGCGKSTLLRLIAGLLQPTRGRIFFGSRDVTDLDTRRRNAVMCFQNYALWPHMTVRQNIRFGLDVRAAPASGQRVEEILRLVQLEPWADRKPAALSGGQQQRVALARALAVRPDCLLLDEPLSNLDAKLRQEMRGEIRRICKSAGLTTIYVTHDQKEAMSVADRVAVMNEGKIIQIGTPTELYHKPRRAFVADFLGQTNLISGVVVGRDGSTVSVQTALGILLAHGDEALPDHVTLSVRPERMRLLRPADKAEPAVNRIPGKIVESSFLGEATQYVLAVGGQRLTVIGSCPLPDGVAEAVIQFDPRDAIVLPE